jgi:hypothetical protein
VRRTRWTAPCLLLLGLGLTGPALRAEGPLGFWSPRDLEGMTKRRWEAASNRTRDEILKLNRELKTWPEACEVVFGAKEYAGDTAFLGHVADQLTDSTFTRLEATYRLIHWERILSGDLVFPGRGFVAYDDPYTVAGRANWLLRTVTETSFGYVRPGATADELAELKRKWKSYLAGEKPAAFERPYAAANARDEELFDPVAIEVLVRSFAPNPAKESLIQACLAKVGAKDLPTDPVADKAAMCNPDISARIFLREVTDVKEDLSPEAWNAWWKENHEHLKWNAATAKFESGGTAAGTH